MKLLQPLFVSFVVAATTVAACGSHSTSTAGVGAGISVGTHATTGTGAHTTTTGSHMTTGSTMTTGTSSGGSCKAGGVACESFEECCSGTCANQECTTCGATGDDCSLGCCNGLSCYQDKCGSCKGDDSICNLASDCCSNICNNGTCEACNVNGTGCTTSAQCCKGSLCSEGACCAGAGSSCNDTSECCSGQTCNNGTCGAACTDTGSGCSTNAECCTDHCCNGTCSATACSTSTSSSSSTSSGGGNVPTTCVQAYQGVGCCSAAGNLYYCGATTDPAPTEQTCTTGMVCGWNATAGYYDCVASPGGADPSGTNPKLCQ